MKFKILYGGQIKKSKGDFSIHFKILEEDENIPFISLYPEQFNKDLSNLINPDDIVIDTKKPPKLEIDYPLTQPFVIQLDKSKWTRYEIAKKIGQLYQQIYKEELQGPEKKYGIYGHSLGDLVLVLIKYNKKKNLLTLSVDS